MYRSACLACACGLIAVFFNGLEAQTEPRAAAAAQPQVPPTRSA
jgi:hypothetical protein